MRRIQIVITKIMSLSLRTSFGLLLISLWSSLALAQEAQVPSDVVNLQASGKEEAVDLSWPPAEDPDGVVLAYRIYYGTTSVQTAEDFYTETIDTDTPDTTYTIEGLANGLDYYFAVTALDDEANESLNYSPEASAQPRSLAADSPSVIGANQIGPSEVEVSMSKSVALLSKTDAFIIEEKGNPSNEVKVEDAFIDGPNVVLQVPGTELLVGRTYVVTATSAVEDLDGNPVSSGITDTADFTALDPTAFQIPDPIVEVEDPVIEEVDPLPIIEDLPVIEDTKPSAPPLDTNAPLDASDLSVDGQGIVNDLASVAWTPAPDIEGDIIDQVLYVKKGLSDWDSGYSVGVGVSETKILVESDQNYEVRLVTIDKSGNRSDGVITQFSTKLAESGPGDLASITTLGLGLVLLFILVAGSGRRQT